MVTTEDLLRSIVSATTFDERVFLIRTIPEHVGTALQPTLFSDIARRLYVGALAPDFAFIHWSDDYELEPFREDYARAYTITAGFTNVSVGDIERALAEAPRALRVFRQILGLGSQEFAAATELVKVGDGRALSNSRIKALEGGGALKAGEGIVLATVIDLAMAGTLFGPAPPGVRGKTAKPDTERGWASVRDFAELKVPYATYLHQRHYGGAFRQLLDATSTNRGDVLEDAVEQQFLAARIPFLRTGGHDQQAITARFGLTVTPAPDFVVWDHTERLRAILECKGANDGGTARDKAARFRALRAEGQRLGGVPVFAVLGGLGWKRTRDALGPVIQATEGRTFTLSNVHSMLDVQPLSELKAPAP